MLRVTELEPRTPHQPEKLKKLSKNDLVVLLLFLESIKTTRLYLIYFQSSAAHPQPGDRILCIPAKPFHVESLRGAGFQDFERALSPCCAFLQACCGCENLVKASPDKESHNSTAFANSRFIHWNPLSRLNLSRQGLIP
jgi:hypothetical protein